MIRQKCGRSEFPRRRHSAASSSDLLGFVVVTHPFHALNGQRLEILFAKRRAGAMVFVCAGGFSGQITLPESWTDRGEPRRRTGCRPMGSRRSAPYKKSEHRKALIPLLAGPPMAPSSSSTRTSAASW